MVDHQPVEEKITQNDQKRVQTRVEISRLQKGKESRDKKEKERKIKIRPLESEKIFPERSQKPSQSEEKHPDPKKTLVSKKTPAPVSNE